MARTWGMKDSSLRSGKATDNMVAHVRESRITATSGRPAPDRDLRMLHNGNDTSGACNMHEPEHNAQKGI
eukprot:4057588-Karenia_brevis.AAC.1